MRSNLVLRARASVAVLTLVAITGAAIVIGATPVAAAEAPPVPTPVVTFESIFEALERLRSRPAAPKPCSEAGAGEVPVLVAEIFRCHLRGAGWAEEDVRRVAGEAILVSHCESLWDPAAVVFDGRYRDVPHPNGNRYSAAGIFQFIRKTADKWIEGGYAQVADPRRNIDAAARLYLHNRGRGYGGWDDWACAAANDGFKQGSVLPGWPGGPEALPEWVFQY